MAICVGSKCNRIRGKGSGRRYHRSVYVFGLVAALYAGMPRASPAVAFVPGATTRAMDWSDRVWDLLQVIFDTMVYTPVQTGSLDVNEGLLHLVNSWSETGLPEGLTADDVKTVLQALTELELLLLAQPWQLSPDVLTSSLRTIDAMRAALMGLSPAGPNDGGAR